MTEQPPTGKRTILEIVNLVDITDKGTYVLINKRKLYRIMIALLLYGIVLGFIIFKVIYLGV